MNEFFKKINGLGMVANICNASAVETAARGPWVQGLPGWHVEILSWLKKKKSKQKMSKYPQGRFSRSVTKQVSHRLDYPEFKKEYGLWFQYPVLGGGCSTQ